MREHDGEVDKINDLFASPLVAMMERDTIAKCEHDGAIDNIKEQSHAR